MSRFASTKLREIDLWEGEWVKIPTALSYAQVIKLTSSTNEAEMSKNMLVECIKEWNLKDEDGVIPQVNEQNIMRLDMLTIEKISSQIIPLITNDQDKKK
jgi:hypothetical protein